MDSDSVYPPAKQPPDKEKSSNTCIDCVGQHFGNTGLVECLTKKIDCPWALIFGNTRFCNHPSAKEFVS